MKTATKPRQPKTDSPEAIEAMKRASRISPAEAALGPIDHGPPTTPGLEDDPPAPLHDVREDDDDPPAAEAAGEDTPELRLVVPNFDAAGLIGQVGDFILTEMKAARNLKPWEQLREHEQQWQIERARGQAEALVRGIAEAIAERGFYSIDGVIEEKGSWDGNTVQIKVGAIKSTANLAALSAGGKIVQIVFADAAQFAGAMESKPQPNQRDLLASADGPDEDGGGDGEDSEPDDEDEIDPETGEIKTPVAPPADAPAEQPAV